MHVERDDPGFYLQAIIVDVMTDKVFEIAEADKAGRGSVTPMRSTKGLPR